MEEKEEEEKEVEGEEEKEEEVKDPDLQCRSQILWGKYSNCACRNMLALG